MHILLAANTNYLIQLLALLYSIFEHNDTDITIHFFHHDMAEHNLKKLTHFCQQWGNKKFIPYYISDEHCAKMKVSAVYPAEIYYRIFAIDILPDTVTRILYLDADTIVQSPLSELYSTEISHYAFAACPDIYASLIGIKENHLARLNLPSDGNYANSGVLLLNLSYLREDNAAAKLTEYIRSCGQDIPFPDQDALNKLYYGKIKYIPWEKYNCIPATYIKQDGSLLLCQEINLLLQEYGTDYVDRISLTEQYRQNASILHYAGTRKPWNAEQGDPHAVELFEQPWYDAAFAAADLYKKL